jgi:RNA polymerase sigma factor (sigma-70 family)
MATDAQLLQQYARDGSQAAFGELVSRHLGLVYSVAVRQVTDTHLAEDVTQMVFANLARKARVLPDRVVLPGWLHRDTCFTALEVLRKERRRRAREELALRMSPADPNSPGGGEGLLPLLDEALNHLHPTDRDAILLRFFEQRSLKEVGLALHLGEDATRKRVERALDKLRVWLVRRGISTTAAALSAAVTGLAPQAAPAGLASCASTFALTTVTSATGGIALLNLLKAPAMLTMKKALLVAAVATGVSAPVLVHYYGQQRLDQQRITLTSQQAGLERLQAENQRLTRALSTAQQDQKLSAAQLSELLRLRSEAGRLRAELRDRQNDPKKTGAAQNQGSVTEEEPGLKAGDEQQAFQATATVQMRPGQTVVMEGWPTAPGLRTLVLVTPSLDPGQPNAGTLLLQSRVIEAPEQLLKGLGVSLQEDGQAGSNSCSVLEQASAEALVKALEAQEGVKTLSAPRVVTLSGKQAQVTMMAAETSQFGQTKGFLNSIDLTPHWDPVQSSLNLVVNASRREQMAAKREQANSEESVRRPVPLPPPR